MPSNPTIAGAYADNAIVLVQQLDSGETGEHVDALGFDEPGQPLHEPAQRDDVVAVIGQRRRRNRKLNLRAAREEVDVIVMNVRSEWRTALFEVGEEHLERGWIEHRAGEHVSARLARLLEHRNRQRLAARRFLELGEPKRCRHAGRSAADDEDIDFEGFAIQVSSQLPAASLQL